MRPVETRFALLTANQGYSERVGSQKILLTILRRSGELLSHVSANLGAGAGGRLARSAPRFLKMAWRDPLVRSRRQDKVGLGPLTPSRGQKSQARGRRPSRGASAFSGYERFAERAYVLFINWHANMLSTDRYPRLKMFWRFASWLFRTGPGAS
jgi:hypothetical protein